MAIPSKFRTFSATILLLLLGLTIYGCGDTSHKARIRRSTGGGGANGKLSKADARTVKNIATKINTAKGKGPSIEWSVTGKQSTFRLEKIIVDNYPKPQRYLIDHKVSLKNGIDFESDKPTPTSTKAPETPLVYASELSFPEVIEWKKNQDGTEGELIPKTGESVFYSFKPSKKNLAEYDVAYSDESGFPRLIEEILLPANFDENTKKYQITLTNSDEEADENIYEFRTSVRLSRVTNATRRLIIHVLVAMTIKESTTEKADKDGEEEEETEAKKLKDKTPRAGVKPKIQESNFVLIYREQKGNNIADNTEELLDQKEGE